MGYVEKKLLIETLKSDSQFTDSEIELLDELISTDIIYDNEAVMDSKALSQLEKNGLRNKFLSFCDKNHWFPKWVCNAKRGID